MGLPWFQVAWANLDDGLVAYYEFEGNATDSSGNENHGTEHGGLNYTAGKIGQSAQFDGVDDYIQINPQSDMSSVGDFTIVTWVYLEGWKSQSAGPHLDRQYIFDGHSHSSTTPDDFSRPGFNLVYDLNDDEEIHNFIRFNDSNTTEQNTRVSVSGAWHQLLLMRKGADDFTYFDGELLPATYARNQPSDQPLNMAHNWFIGTFSGNNPHYRNGVFNYSFFGLIDDLRIYNRALSECEVQSLFTGEDECSPPPVGCSDDPATYSNETRQAILPCVEIPLYTDINGSPIEFTGLYSAVLEIPFGFSDFEAKALNFLEIIEESDPNHARFNPDSGILDIPRIDIPTIVPLLGGGTVPGPTLQCHAKLQQSALRGEVLMLQDFDCNLP
jgi:hypothetical protein